MRKVASSSTLHVQANIC